MKRMILMSLMLLVLAGCTATYEIPVVRPSTWDEEELKAAGLRLTTKYGRGNILAIYGGEKGNRLNPDLLTDELWLNFIRERTRTRDTRPMDDWNWDPGTTARVHIYWMDTTGPLNYQVKIEFIKDGKVLGKTGTGGGRSQFGYYRDMQKLGIFIP